MKQCNVLNCEIQVLYNALHFCASLNFNHSFGRSENTTINFFAVAICDGVGRCWQTMSPCHYGVSNEKTLTLVILWGNYKWHILSFNLENMLHRCKQCIVLQLHRTKISQSFVALRKDFTTTTVLFLFNHRLQEAQTTTPQQRGWAQKKMDSTMIILRRENLTKDLEWCIECGLW